MIILASIENFGDSLFSKACVNLFKFIVKYTRSTALIILEYVLNQVRKVLLNNKLFTMAE